MESSVESSRKLTTETKELTLIDLISYHKINMRLGAVCATLSIILICSLLSNKVFRKRNKLIIGLAFADFMNCLGIMLMGINRVNLYEDVLSENEFRVETSWSCALQTWLFVKTIGDLWPPIIQSFMGLEQLLCVICGNSNQRRQNFLLLVSVLFVFLTVSTGYTLSFENRNNGFVKYYCGRKASFGRIYSGFIYIHNIVGYVLGIILNSIAISKIKPPSCDPNEKKFYSRRMIEIRSCLLVSCISTLLVSLPNSISVTSLLVTSVKDSISKPSVWATCINSGINLFIYLALNDKFRKHTTFLLTREEYDSTNSENLEDEEFEPTLLNQYDSCQKLKLSI